MRPWCQRENAENEPRHVDFFDAVRASPAMIGAAISLVWQALGLRGVLIIAAMVGVVAVYFVILDRGGDQREAEIAEDNRRSIDSKVRAGTRVDRCFAVGGEWDNTMERCDLEAVVPTLPRRRP